LDNKSLQGDIYLREYYRENPPLNKAGENASAKKPE
jgi:hypothetical protein